MPASPEFAEQTVLTPEQQTLMAALASVIAPLSQLCVAKGITIQTFEEQVRKAFVQAARDAYSGPTGAASTRLTSRISATTGLTRREVARLEREPEPTQSPRRSPVTEVFTRWLADPALHDSSRKPMALPRQGPAPSFEALAQSVTRDVHPRSLLDELCRLRLAEHDVESDTVRLVRDAFVPRGDWPRMVAFLGDNVGDHLRAAAANVLGDGKQHIEQAIFADELSTVSLERARALMSEQWRTLLEQIAPRLEQLIEEDVQAGRPQNQSIRIGLFTWSQTMPGAPQDPTP